MPIISTQSGCTRSHSLTDSADVSLPPPKKISPDPIISDICCCNLTPEQSFLNIKVRKIRFLFNLKQQIGKGCYGSVSLATCCTHNKSFAIKWLDEDTGMPKNKSRVESNEILAFLKTISDANIMKFHAEYLESSPDSVEEGMKSRYLAFEYIEGFDLNTAFKLITGMTEDTIHYLMDQFFNISSALEQYNIWHGDLNFKNIMYCIHTHTLKVVDFGLSKFFTSRGTNAKIQQHAQLFIELGSKILYSFIENLKFQLYNKSMNTDKLIIWIQSESDKFQTYDENPILSPPKQEQLPSTWDELQLINLSICQENIIRLTNETVIKIIAWSTIIHSLFDNNVPFKSYSKHFTEEHFLNFKKDLISPDDTNLRELYDFNLTLES